MLHGKVMHMKDITENLGDRLKKLRMDRNLTQSQLAGILGVEQNTVSAYEMGQRQPSYDVLLTLASYYHVSTDYLLGSESDYLINATGLDGKEMSLVAELVANMSEKNKKLEK